MYFAPINKIDQFVETDAQKLALYKIYGQEMSNIHIG